MKRGFFGISLLGLVILTLAASTPALADWLPLDENAARGEPQIRVLADAPSLLHLQVTIPGMSVQERPTPEGTDTWLEIPGHGHTLAVGAPAVPVIRFIAQLPFGAQLQTRAVASSGRSFKMGSGALGERLYPVQPSRRKDEDRSNLARFQRDQAAYLRPGAIPAELVSVREMGEMRGHRLVLVEVSPVAYDPVAGSLLCHDRIDVMITMSGADMEQTLAKSKRYYSPPFDRLLSSISVNHDTFLGGAREIPALPIGLLIITADEFESNLAPLAEWKTLKGYYTTVANLSETGSSREAITDYIADAYNNWEVPPTWVLLVGDTNLIPYYTGQATGSATDLYYGTITGGDFLPEIHLGRFPARSTTHVNTMVEKVVDFEKLMLSNGTDFMNRATWIASADHGALAEQTHNYVIENYFPDEMEHILIYQRLGGNTQDIINAVNGGTVIVNYSGHGYDAGWGCVPFSQYYVRNLTNLDMYPFVLSNACLTGRYSNVECFAETWVIEADKGATSFVGCSTYSYWDEDDIFEKELWEAFWMESMFTLGQLCDDGLFGVYVHYGGAGRSRYYFEGYNIMGDPSMDLWATYPNVLEADYQPVLPIGMSEFAITVTEDGAPLNSALVCLYMPGEVYETAYTDASGQATIEIDPLPQNAGTMYVTATKHDHEPHLGSVEVIVPDGPYLIFHSLELDDDQSGGSSGNGDGEADAGERLELLVTLENVGTEPGHNVVAVLTSDDPFAGILEDIADFGTIDAGEIGTNINGLLVRIDGGCPDGRVIRFDLAITCDDRPTWETGFDVTVAAPTLTITRVQIDDTGSGNGNGRPDPGEQIEYHVSLTNFGSTDACNVAVNLLSGSDMVEVNQGAASAPLIGPGQMVELGPVFVLTVSPDSPLAEEYPLWFQVSAEWGYRISLSTVLAVGGLCDDVEAGQGNWTHYPGTIDFADQWHRSWQRNHTAGGMWSWKQGDTGPDNYATYCDGCLVTESLPLGVECTRLRFWHWMDAEVSPYPDQCYDGGLVEVSINGGPWQQITPEEGYTHQIRYGGTNGPFPLGTPVYSGTFDWTAALFVLEGGSGTAQFRFRFGSNGVNCMEGWYIDDVVISGTSGGMQDAEEQWRPVALHTVLAQNMPNPFRPATVISFELPRTQDVSLRIFDAGGRLVRTLADGRHQAGLYRLSWDGSNESGRGLPSGVYYYRLQTDEDVLTRSMRLVR